MYIYSKIYICIVKSAVKIIATVTVIIQEPQELWDRLV